MPLRNKEAERVWLSDAATLLFEKYYSRIPKGRSARDVCAMNKIDVDVEIIDPCDLETRLPKLFHCRTENRHVITAPIERVMQKESWTECAIAFSIYSRIIRHWFTTFEVDWPLYREQYWKFEVLCDNFAMEMVLVSLGYPRIKEMDVFGEYLLACTECSIADRAAYWRQLGARIKQRVKSARITDPDVDLQPLEALARQFLSAGP
jgi:hypothetical protein